MTILYEDADLIAVDKPAGVYVHPSPGHERGALSSLLAARYPEIAAVGSPDRPGVVHRLDAGTSGVMVFARNQSAYLALRRQFERHDRIEKVYLAVLHGRLPAPAGVERSPIGRKRWDPRRMAVDSAGLPATTRWRTLARRNGLSLVEFSIETGRTHQIRVHAAHLGCPIVGDPLYGDAARDRRLSPHPSRMFLHACRIELDHPATGERIGFAAPPPNDFAYVG